MADPTKSNVSRVRTGAPHKSTLVTAWQVKLTGIEFIKDVYLSENGDNLSDKAPDRINYPKIKENFHGWGRGPYIEGWDWKGSDNLDRYACYVRLTPVVMKVRLNCSPAAPTARTFTLLVDPTLDGDATLLTSGSLSVKWPAGSKEQIVEIATGGAFPDEISRYDLRLTWSVKDVVVSAADGSTNPGIAGVIQKTRHTIFSIYDFPREPTDNSEEGRNFFLDSGLTKQRLDKITQVLGRRSPTKQTSDVEEIVWKIHKIVNDSHDPPYFYGDRSFKIRYGYAQPDKKAKSKTKTPDPIDIHPVDQWVMWAPSGTGYKGAFPHWNFGACITYIQLMKTMLAMIGIQARLSWVIPKTTQLPNVDDRKPLSESDIVDFDSHSELPSQKHDFPDKAGVNWPGEVVLIERPEKSGWELFEGCLSFNKRFYPGAIPSRLYPDAVQRDHRGFGSGMDVLRWWINVKHGKFQRFLVWKAQIGDVVWFFDRDGVPYKDAYKMTNPSDWLPIE